MIFFVDNDGTIIKSGPSSVYQGSEDASSVCVVAPFAINAEVTAVFKLPQGELKSPLLLTCAGEIEGVVNSATGVNYALWKRDIPEPIARYYGEVQVQFFFHFADRLLTTSTTTFTVGKGVAVELPKVPPQTIYDDILRSISSLRSQTDTALNQLRIATEQARRMAEEAQETAESVQTTAEESAQAAADSAKSAAESAAESASYVREAAAIDNVEATVIHTKYGNAPKVSVENRGTPVHADFAFDFEIPEGKQGASGVVTAAVGLPTLYIENGDLYALVPEGSENPYSINEDGELMLEVAREV